MRILLRDELDGTKVDLAVFGSDGNAELVEYGGASVTVVKGTEVDVTVNMKRFTTGAGAGAGAGTSATTGASFGRNAK